MRRKRTRESEGLASAARAHVLRRLRDAARLARDGLPESIDQFRELLGDVAARAAAWDVAHGDPRAASSVLRAALAIGEDGAGEPVREFLLIPYGEVVVDRPVQGGNFVFTRRHAESAAQWFEQIGRKLAIDYEHQSFDRLNTRPDGLRPAAGWIGRLQAREDGLWAADVTWTPRARELLRSGEYRYFSPVIYWTDAERSDVAGLGPVALTNDPAMRGVPGLAAGSAAEPPDASDAVDEPAEDGAAPREEVEAELELLRRQLRSQEADTFVERGLRQGRIVECTSQDWREEYLRDPQTAVERLQRAPVLLPPGRVIQPPQPGARSAAVGLADVHGRLGIEAADLEAYERAAAAGRVRRFSGASE